MTSRGNTNTLRTVTETPEGTSSGIKQFRCGDVVPGCTVRFEGTVADVLTQVERHAATDHGVTPDDGLRDRVRRALRPR